MIVLGYPTCFSPVAPLLQCPLHRRHWLSVGCYVPLSNSDHLRPRPRPSLYFLMCFVCAPPNKWSDTSEHDSNAPTLSILFWGAAAPRFGGTAALSMEREQSHWIGRWQLLILIIVCVFVVVFCVWEWLLANIPVESQHRPRQNCQLLCTHITKSAPKDPKYKCMCKTICTCFDLLVKVSVGHAMSVQKAC